MKPGERLVPLLLTLLGAALRWHDLTARSLWFDEAISLLRIAGSWGDNLVNRISIFGNVSTDTHPPLYFLLLKLWVALFDDREWSLRLGTAMAGVLLVPCVWLLARVVFGRRVALVAALLALLAPVFQWYSHEIRNYALTASMACLSSAAAVLALRQPRFLARFGVVALLACVTHFTLVVMTGVQVFVIAAHHARAAGLLRVSLARARVPLLAIGVAGLLLAGIFAPQVVPRLFTGAEQNFQFVGLDRIALSLFGSIVFGLNWRTPVDDLVALAIGALVVVAMARSVRARQPAPIALACFTVAPVLVWFAGSFIKPNFQGVRHLILVVPLLLAWLASLIDMRPVTRRLAPAWLILGVLGAGQLYGLVQNHTRTPDLHDDWRGIGNFIRENFLPGDTVISEGEIDRYLVAQYAEPAPTEKWMQEQLPRVATRGRIFWVSTDATAQLEPTVRSADQQLVLRRRIEFPGRSRPISVAIYESASRLGPQAMPASFERIAAPVSATHTTLIGFDITRGNPYAVNPNMYLRALWRRGGESPELLKQLGASARLNHVGRLWWQGDLFEPMDDFAQAQPPGAQFVTHHFLPVPLGMPNVGYELELRVFTPEQTDPLQVHRQPAPQIVVDCCVRQLFWYADAQDSRRMLQDPGRVRDLALASDAIWQLPGLQLGRAEFERSIRVGETLPVVLTWRAQRLGVEASGTRLDIIDALGNPVAGGREAAGTPGFEWPVGQAVREQQDVTLPITTRPGWYRLRLTQSGTAGARNTILAWINVLDVDRAPPNRAPPNRIDARAGGLQLLGWSARPVFARGAAIDLTTFWVVEQALEPDGVMFVHLRAVDGNRAIRQHDQDPRNGQRNTLTFRVGEGIAQRHDTLVLPEDLPPGEYVIVGGVYDRATGLRWPATQNGARAQDDLIELLRFRMP